MYVRSIVLFILRALICAAIYYFGVRSHIKMSLLYGFALMSIVYLYILLFTKGKLISKIFSKTSRVMYDKNTQSVAVFMKSRSYTVSVKDNVVSAVRNSHTFELTVEKYIVAIFWQHLKAADFNQRVVTDTFNYVESIEKFGNGMLMHLKENSEIEAERLISYILEMSQNRM